MRESGHVPVSVVLITLNAASQIESCLDSVGFADEVVVVDSGSRDATPRLAAARGARVVTEAWRGFGAQKQFAVEAARNEWVLCLDADERVTPELAAEIVRVLARPDCPAYRFARCNRFLGRFLRHGEGYPDWSLRLFDRRRARWTDDPVHEKVVCDGPVGELRGDLMHDSAETIESYIAKQNRYTSLAAQAAAARGKRATPLRMLGSPVLRFVKFFVFRRGFLDGLPGLVHTLIGCANSFLKYAKMLEIQRQGGKPAQRLR